MATLNQLTTEMKQARALRQVTMVQARRLRREQQFASLRQWIGDARYLTREIVRCKRLIRVLQTDAFN